MKAEPLVAIFEYDTPVRIQKFAEHKFSEEPLEPYVPTQHDMLNYYQDWSELEGVELWKYLVLVGNYHETFEILKFDTIWIWVIAHKSQSLLSASFIGGEM